MENQQNSQRISSNTSSTYTEKSMQKYRSNNIYEAENAVPSIDIYLVED